MMLGPACLHVSKPMTPVRSTSPKMVSNKCTSVRFAPRSFAARRSAPLSFRNDAAHAPVTIEPESFLARRDNFTAGVISNSVWRNRRALNPLGDASSLTNAFVFCV
jgi:hypothetical protein